MNIQIVIPSYRSPERLDRCLQGIADCWADGRMSNLPKIMVVSDFSDRMMAEEEVCKAQGIPWVGLVERHGYTKLVNKAMRETNSDIVVFLNSDAILQKFDVLKVAGKFEKDKNLGVCGAKLYFPDGTIQHAGGYVIWTDTGHYGWHQPDGPQFDQEYYVPYVTGALMAVRRQTWKDLGGFDEKYWFGCEDTQFCFQAWEEGWKVLYTPDIQAVHEEGGTRNDPRLETLDKARVRVEFEKSVQRLKLFMTYFDWNPVFKSIWKANGENKRLILERSGAIGDVLSITSFLPFLDSMDGWEIHFRANEGPAQILLDNPHIVTSGPKVIDPFALTITLNTAHEKHPEVQLENSYFNQMIHVPVFNGPAIFLTKPEIHSRDWDWHAILSKYAQDLVSHQDEKGQLHYQPYFVIHAGNTHWRSRNLHRIFWEEVAIGLMSLGLKAVLIGTKADWFLNLPGVLDLREKTTIQELHQLIAHAKLYVGPDSFPLHCAQATETPFVGVFTSTRPELFISQNAQAHAVVTPPESSCRFCYERQKPPIWSLEGCPEQKEYECQRTIDAQEVIRKAKNLLAPKKLEVVK